MNLNKNIGCFILMSACAASSFAQDADSVVWKYPVATYGDVGVINKVVIKHDAIDVYVHESHDGRFSECGGFDGWYVDDEKGRKHELMGVEAAEGKTGKGVNVLRFRNADTDVQVFDLMSDGTGKRFGVYGICDMKDAGRFSASWHAAVERAGSAKRLALREGKMRNARVKGSVQGYDSKYGKGFVYALNEYAAGEPSVYYARVQDDGSFVLDIPSDRMRLMHAVLDAGGKRVKVPFVAVPGETTSFSYEKGDDGAYDVSYDNSACSGNVLSSRFLKCYRESLMGSPYEQHEGFDTDWYERAIYANRAGHSAMAVYCAWKYGLSWPEMRLMQLDADVGYYTNLVYLGKFEGGKAGAFFNAEDWKRCRELLREPLVSVLPDYNRFRHAMADVDLWHETETAVKAGSAVADKSVRSVFESVEPLRGYASVQSGPAFYQVVFVDGSRETMDMLGRLDNLMADYADSPDLKFLFVMCDSLYGSEDVRMVREHFLQGQECVNVSLSDYYNINECLGNVTNVAVSKTLDRRGIVLERSFDLRDEGTFRRMLRQRLKKK